MIRPSLPPSAPRPFSRHTACAVTRNDLPHGAVRCVQPNLYQIKNFSVCLIWSIIRKVGHRRIRRTVADYFRLRRSRKPVSKGLTEEAGKHPVRRLGKGVPAPDVAEDLGISIRHVRRLWARFQKTGTMRVQMGRPRACITGARIRLITGAHQRRPVGVVRTARELGRNHDISYAAVYRVLKKSGAAEASAARSHRRKWVRYGRAYSNAMWHTDWHVIKDPRSSGMNLITCLDDASRCVTGAALFEHATSENAVMPLRLAIKRFGAPASMLSDDGSCLAGQNGRRKGTGTWQPTVFGEELPEGDIALINARPCRPQTNGKLERFHRSPEEEMHHYGSLREYTDYYNESRLHFSLDIDNCEAPRMAFRNKRATEAIRKNDPKWMEKDAHE